MYQTNSSGDWHARALERVQRLGFSSIMQYAAERPGVVLADLAKEIGGDDLTGVQVMQLLLEEAILTNAIPLVLRDLLVRWLRQALPHGWKQPLDDEPRSEVARALAGWETEIEVHLNKLDEELMLDAGQDLLNAKLPTGWRPEGPDDPIIVAFVNRCLGRFPS